LSDLPAGGGCTDVVLVVVTFNSEGVIADLIDSLPAALEGCTWSLVVADNDSHDATVALVRRLAPAATVVEMGRNAGFAAGINAALAAALPAKAALILNADIRLSADSVGVMLACLDQPGVGIVAPRLIDPDGSLSYSLRREPTLRRAASDSLFGHRLLKRFGSWSEWVVDPVSYAKQTRVDWAAGPALLISRACLDACGPWDESFFLYSEETDYCLRARDRGFDLLFTPDADVVHIGGESSLSPRLWSLVVVNRVRLFGRRRSRVATAVFWLIAVLREGSRAVLGRKTSQQALLTLLSRRRMREAPVRASGAAVVTAET
jgi:N-acetylglucosaminyl-diphospho-decaprenol L-rhamnosyltransferase